MTTLPVIMLTYCLLVEEGTDKSLAMTILDAFFDLHEGND
jgi:hypothetical protein